MSVLEGKLPQGLAVTININRVDKVLIAWLPQGSHQLRETVLFWKFFKPIGSIPHCYYGERLWSTLALCGYVAHCGLDYCLQFKTF